MSSLITNTVIISSLAVLMIGQLVLLQKTRSLRTRLQLASISLDELVKTMLQLHPMSIGFTARVKA
ncbi:MAG: hypothetical protein KDB27_03780, partial [Planctomycetales bacterium]|nr:hypothetical protein [Planctomycetales bacterium]